MSRARCCDENVAMRVSSFLQFCFSFLFRVRESGRIFELICPNLNRRLMRFGFVSPLY
jgi:hypothetical protein